jgi:hypothetical protein
MTLTKEEKKLIRDALIRAQVLIAALIETAEEGSRTRFNPERFTTAGVAQEAIEEAMLLFVKERPPDQAAKERDRSLRRIRALAKRALQSTSEETVRTKVEAIRAIADEALSVTIRQASCKTPCTTKTR